MPVGGPPPPPSMPGALQRFSLTLTFDHITDKGSFALSL